MNTIYYLFVNSRILFKMMKIATLITLVLSYASLAASFMIQPSATFSTRLQMADGDDPVRTGTVKWFNTEKGFGFIVPDDGEQDVFVHQTSIKSEGFRSLAENESVEFTTMEEADGRVKASYVTGPGGVDVQGAPFDGY